MDSTDQCRKKRKPIKESITNPKKIICKEEITCPDSAGKKLISSKIPENDNNEAGGSKVISRCEKTCPIASTQDFDGRLLWGYFHRKDLESSEIRSSELFTKSPNISNRMRGVILEWIMGICEAYSFQRETYYLTLHYFDIFLSNSENIAANKLQLISVTCLLIAAKYEEIHPLRVSELAYLTDGGCTINEILNTEVLVLTSINWKTTVITPDKWLSLFLQLMYIEEGDIIVETKFNIQLYNKISKLLDLCSLHDGFLNYPYHLLVATAFNLVCPKPDALEKLGLCSSDIKQCCKWLKPFWKTLQEKCGEEPLEIGFKALPAGPKPGDYNYRVMKRKVSLDLLDFVQ